MYLVKALRLRHLFLTALFVLGAALIWGIGCSRPKPRGSLVYQPVVAQAPRAKADDFINRFRLARDVELSRQQENLERLVGSAQTDESVRAQAEKELWRLTQVEAAEHQAEAVLAVEGWDQTVVTVMDDEATVVIHGRSLTAAEAADIGRIVAKATGLGEEAVRIIERR